MKERSGFSMRGCMIVIVVLAVAVVGVHHVLIRPLITKRVKEWAHRNVPEEMRGKFETFMDQPVDLPPRFFEPITVSTEVEDAMANVKSLYKQHKPQQIDFGALDTVEQGGEITDETWTEIQQDLQRIQPYIEALIELANRDDYRLELEELPSFLELQIGAKVLCLRACLEAKSGQWMEAFRSNLASHRLAVRRPDSSLIGHLVAIAIQGISSTNTSFLASRCPDPNALHEALGHLRELAPRVNLDLLDRALEVDMITSLRKAKKEGYEVSLLPGKPGRFYLRQLMDWMMSQRSEGSSSQFPPKLVVQLARTLGYGQAFEYVFFAVALPNFVAAETREDVSVSEYHLAQLTVASKLAELTEGEVPTEVSELVPNYLSDKPEDPFAETEVSYPFHKEQGMFYGIGPDEQDDQLRVLYSPSNGTVSNGDIAPYDFR